MHRRVLAGGGVDEARPEAAGRDAERHRGATEPRDGGGRQAQAAAEPREVGV